MQQETIFALATGVGKSAIAVVRISGPQTRALVQAFAGRLPEPRTAMLASLRQPKDAGLLDRALVLWFPAPNSFTGEDCAEFHLHGGRAVIAGIIAAVAAFAGCRPAEPGEFTRRAFLNGKMDLTEVEGLADLIDAETQAQRQQALRQLDGVLGQQAERWRGLLLQAQAAVEAEIDFSDEGDVPADVAAHTSQQIRSILSELKALLTAPPIGERMREGFHVVITGPPNAGKSTLMNALAKRDVAIVSPHAGTTRDLLEVHLELQGLPVILVDTAGLREASDEVEQEGVRRSRMRAEQADLILNLREVGQARGDLVAPPDTPQIHVLTKADVHPEVATSEHLAISARTGAGLDKLVAEIGDRAKAGLVGGGSALITRERHRHALEASAECLTRLLEAEDLPIELVAEELRLAANALGRISGRISAEDVLGEIFSSFCIGK